MKRDLAIDYLRSAVTVAVVAHHSALAYNTFSRFDSQRYTQSTAPVVDAVRFAPLDYLVAWNDIWFMSLLFFVSGLFVPGSLARKGAGRFVAERARRLGVPFAAAVLVLMPLAYYPSFLLSAGAPQGGYLARFFTTDGWPVGPPWFLWLLLAFSGIAALVPAFRWENPSAGRLASVFLLVTLLAVVPVRAVVPAYAWTSLGGPFDVQSSRVLLYAAWFAMGMSLAGKELKYGPWPLWLAIGLAAFAAHWTALVPTAIAFSVCCAFTCLGALGAARFCFRRSWAPADSFSANAYGVYVIHYVFVTWMQFALLGTPWPAALKFGITFVFATGASWLMTAALRRTPAGRFL